MLVLSRKLNEKIKIGDDITVTVTSVHKGRVQLGVSAPKNVRVLRGEIVERIAAGETQAK